MFLDPFFFGGGGGLPSDLGGFVAGALVVAVLAVLFAGGRDDDRARVRPLARYLGAIALFTLFIGLFASFGAVHSLTDLVVDHQARFDDYNAFYEGDEFAPVEGQGVFLPIGYHLYEFSSESTNDGNYAVAVASGLVAFTALGIFFLHERWRRRLMVGRAGTGDAAIRVDRTYHLGRCFVAALITAVGLVAVGFGLFQIIAPGIALGGGDSDVTRAEGISETLSFGVLALASALIFIRSWRRVAPEGGLDVKPAPA